MDAGLVTERLVRTVVLVLATAIGACVATAVALLAREVHR
ncbi:MAG: hypothetical protein RL139_1564 [Gemmatimonadota bacterium]|jgi:hypothetical protein